MNNIIKLNLFELSNLLKTKIATSTDICQAFLTQTKQENEKLNIFIDLDEKSIFEAAKLADERWLTGKNLSDFDGLPIGIKDNITVENQSCRCASNILGDFKSVYDATAIIRLKSKGFIPFGRCNMDEFAMGSTTCNSAFGATKNPIDTNRIPGGSSGGSAAAVAAHCVPATLGSDTGGSIRQPASFCGIIGFKPGYGTLSRYGLVAFASSLDQIGPMATTVEDCALLYDVMRGPCQQDATTIEDFDFNIEALNNASVKGVKIGIPKEYFQYDGITASVKQTMEETLKKLTSLGAEIVEISIPHAPYAIATYYVIATAEASANLARFDGIRYGKRADAPNLIETYAQTREAGFGLEVKRRIILGTYVLSSGYYDAYYLRAQKVRTLIRQDFENAMTKCDVILAPVSPEIAPRFDEQSAQDPMKLYLADIFTTALNLWGGCGLSVPAGKDQSTQMPIGIQFMASPTQAQKVFNVACAFLK